MKVGINFKGVYAKIERIGKDVRDVEQLVLREGAKMAVKRAVEVTPPNSGKRGSGKSVMDKHIADDLLGDGDMNLEVELVRVNKKVRPVPVSRRLGVLVPVSRQAKKKVSVVDASEFLRNKSVIKTGKRAAYRHLGGKSRGFVDGASAKRVVREKKGKSGRLLAGWNAGAVAAGVKLPAWITRHGTSEGRAGFYLKNGFLLFGMENLVEYGSYHFPRIVAYAERRSAEGMRKRLLIELRLASKKWS